VYPHSFRSLLFINAQWLRYESELFALLQRKVVERSREEAFGAAPDAGQEVSSPVRFQDLTPALGERAAKNLAKAGYYAMAVRRLYGALSGEHVEALFTLQPELILSGKPLTPTEARFAEHYRKISGRYVTYMYEHLQPAISHDMETAKEGYNFVDLNPVFDQVKGKVFTDYCHLTPRGNELIAERLYQKMTEGLMAKLISETATGPGQSAEPQGSGK
jgi:hypothetical protein